MDNHSLNQQLLHFLQGSPTPFHAVKGMVGLLEQSGFKRLHEHQNWSSLEPGNYYLTRNDSALLACRIPQNFTAESGIRFIGTHTDSPCLKVKPNAEIDKRGIQLGVEVYGGALLNPWFDRDLSLAGRVVYRSEQGQVEQALIDFETAIAVTPSLAIHLDREANKNHSINPQTDLPPLLGLDHEFDLKAVLKDKLQTQGIQAASVIDYDLSFYDTQPAALIGLNKEFIAGARLDNLLSCFVGLKALLDTKVDTAQVLICNDHEEVGSASAAGAQGTLLKSFIKRVFADNDQVVASSMMVSVDNAHALHPNFADKHDENHGPLMNQGPVIKVNANQRYATTGETAALFKQICEQVKIPVQSFVVRSDMACGSTIGPITATEVGVRTLDVGVPTLAMHSIRELAGDQDPYYLYQALKGFLSAKQLRVESAI